MNQSTSSPLPPRVLVRGVNWLGDTIMTMPAIQRLREAMPPDGHLALLIPEKTADLWQHNPHVNELIVVDRRKSEFSQSRALRKKQFDLAVIFPNSFRSALAPFLARIPRRVGYRGHSRKTLLTESFQSDPRFDTRARLSTSQISSLKSKRKVSSATDIEWRHQSLHYLELIGKLGADATPCAPRIFLTTAEIKASERFFPNDSRPTLGVTPSAEYGPAKCWPMERYIEALREIRVKFDCRVLLFGSQADRAYCKIIASKLNAASKTPDASVLAGKTTVRELCACLSRCRVLLTNDTGPMHLAAAVGTPIVAIFGSTEPILTGPNYPDCEPCHTIIRHQVECSPCFLRDCPIDFRCMNRIATEDVVAAVLKMM